MLLFFVSFGSLAGMGMKTACIENREILIVPSVIIGGTSSVVGGGKFSNGTISAAFTMWFNHLNGGDGNTVRQKNKASVALATILKNQSPFIVTSSGWLLPNPLFGMGAIAIDGGANLVGAEGDLGIILMVKGKDAGRFITYSEVAGGSGTGASVGVDITRYDFTGGNSNIRLSHLEGFRHKAYAGVSALGVVGIGGAISLSRFGKSQYIIGTSFSVSVGFSPFLVDGGYNQGEVEFLK